MTFRDKFNTKPFNYDIFMVLSTSINFSLMSRASDSELIQIRNINRQVQANMIQEGCTTAEYEETVVLNQEIERKLADF